MAGTRPLSDDELNSVAVSLARFPLRDQTLLRLMLNCGYRISELLSLDFGDVWADGRLRPRVRLQPSHLKGGKGAWRRGVSSRTVVLNDEAVAALGGYLFSLFGRAGPQEVSAPLFQSRKGGRLSRWQANRIIQTILGAAGIHGQCRGELSSHALRKTFCTRVYRACGNDINITRVVMGHKYITTTQAYLAVRQAEAESAVLAIGARERWGSSAKANDLVHVRRI